MGFISKYDCTLVRYLNRKYESQGVLFKDIDDYMIYLYYNICKKNDEKYYSMFEDDIIEYSNWQEEVINGNKQEEE